MSYACLHPLFHLLLSGSRLGPLKGQYPGMAFPLLTLTPCWVRGTRKTSCPSTFGPTAARDTSEHPTHYPRCAPASVKPCQGKDKVSALAQYIAKISGKDTRPYSTERAGKGNVRLLQLWQTRARQIPSVTVILARGPKCLVPLSGDLPLPFPPMLEQISWPRGRWGHAGWLVPPCWLSPPWAGKTEVSAPAIALSASKPAPLPFGNQKASGHLNSYIKHN